jgi:hypothetical protein
MREDALAKGYSLWSENTEHLTLGTPWQASGISTNEGYQIPTISNVADAILLLQQSYVSNHWVHIAWIL